MVFIVLSWNKPVIKVLYGNVSPDRMCVNMSDCDMQPCGRVWVFCSALRVIKHRADSGLAVRGPCSSQDGQKVREAEWRRRKKEAIEGRWGEGVKDWFEGGGWGVVKTGKKRERRERLSEMRQNKNKDILVWSNRGGFCRGKSRLGGFWRGDRMIERWRVGGG